MEILVLRRHPGRVISEVDAALRALILREAVDRSGVDVVFDAPSRDWAGRRTVPTVNVYLYDIREDMRRRERGVINEYDDSGRVVTRRLPPRYFKLSYLVTAWTQRPEDEHRLLSALLSCFLLHDALPRDLLTGPLLETGAAVPVTIALPPPEDRSFADVWTALGGELKPSLDVTVSVPIETGQRREVGPPVLTPPVLGIGGFDDWPSHEVKTKTPPAGSADAGDAAGEGDGKGRTAITRQRGKGGRQTTRIRQRPR